MVLRLIVAVVICLTLGRPAANAAEPVRLIDGDTLEIGQTIYRIHAIDAPEAGQKCQRTATATWPCGDEAIDHLSRLIADRPVACTEREVDRYGRTIGDCHAGDVDLGAAMVADGFAWAYTQYSEDYLPEQRAAEAEGIGIWQHSTQTPWDFRADRWARATLEAPDGCPIKGNVSGNGQIYHTPWSPWYSRTKIDPSKGERWFCDEAEATAAGWRAPLR
ncbi:thermonuclease family protein [Roseitranquillus sediminis]|uniref:thermonuclease family protein n=1 Tax=Roseitranquillus sediminis TaxID=2809051 RepID=UPI001D0C8D18|nr:thermonuclease family protein [Roseitranquillus sediminis]MBM9595081.1 thermonuclease family protein [Roseitranquillus sediminis]